MAKKSAKVTKCELYRESQYGADLIFFDEDGSFVGQYSVCWVEFKRIHPIICKGLLVGQIRKLKYTRLKKGFKLEIAKK